MLKRRNFVKGLIASLFVPAIGFEKAIAAVLPKPARVIKSVIIPDPMHNAARVGKPTLIKSREEAEKLFGKGSAISRCFPRR